MIRVRQSLQDQKWRPKHNNNEEGVHEVLSSLFVYLSDPQWIILRLYSDFYYEIPGMSEVRKADLQNRPWKERPWGGYNGVLTLTSSWICLSFLKHIPDKYVVSKAFTITEPPKQCYTQKIITVMRAGVFHGKNPAGFVKKFLQNAWQPGSPLL